MHYWRVEFQQRGSPHIHGMFWLKIAPQVDFDNDASISPVVDFIDRFVTTDVTNSDLSEYLKYQKHKHGHSCRREVRGNSICRFGIPYFPMPQTEILRPLPEETPQISLHRENLKKIQNFLAESARSTTGTSTPPMRFEFSESSVVQSSILFKLVLSNTWESWQRPGAPTCT